MPPPTPQAAAAPGPAPLVRNSTSFPTQMTARLRALHDDYVRLRREGDGTPDALAAAGLKYYQYLVRAVMSAPGYGTGDPGNARGLLVYHTMGMGKTFLAAAVAMALWDVRKPVILAAKSLQGNFRSTVERLVALMDPGLAGGALAAAQAAALARFQFVSLDAHNMAAQVARLTAGAQAADSLSGRLLIVDEAHNLFRGVINSTHGDTNARRVYEMVMAARNLRILFLTGTPASKDPFELVPCFNMLAGYDLLPTQYEDFYRRYVDVPGRAIRNRGKLANRLVGMVSHVTHALPSGPGAGPGGDEAGAGDAPRSLGGFPEELPMVVERVG